MPIDIQGFFSNPVDDLALFLFGLLLRLFIKTDKVSAKLALYLLPLVVKYVRRYYKSGYAHERLSHIEADISLLKKRIKSGKVDLLGQEMALDIKKNITTINQWQGRGKYKVYGLIIHSTWGYYKGSIQWFKNPAAKCSSHYVVKEDGEITLCVIEENTAWHAGNVTVSKEKAPALIQEYWGVNPNIISIGVEVTDNKKRDWDYPTPQYLAVVNLVADICRRHKIVPTRDYLIMHKEIDPINRTDPVGKWDHDKFVLDVSKILKFDKPCLTEVPFQATIHVRSDITGLNVRSGPTLISPKHGEVRDYLLPGETLNVVGYVHGELVNGEDRWWKSEYGNYIWSGGTVEKPEANQVKNFDEKVGDNNMSFSTQELKDAYIAELKAKYETDLAAAEAEVVEAPVAEPAEVEVQPEPVIENVTPEANEVVVEEVPVEEPVAEPSLMDKFNALVEEFRVKVSGLVS